MVAPVVLVVVAILFCGMASLVAPYHLGLLRAAAAGGRLCIVKGEDICQILEFCIRRGGVSKILFKQTVS